MESGKRCTNYIFVYSREHGGIATQEEREEECQEIGWLGERETVYHVSWSRVDLVLWPQEARAMCTLPWHRSGTLLI